MSSELTDEIAALRAAMAEMREVFRSHMHARVVELDGREHSWHCYNCCPGAEAATEAEIPHTADCPLHG